MAQEQVNKPQSQEQETEEVEAKDLRNEELNDSVDDLLDDIDEALGEIENAEQFVAEYQQKGGQ